MKTRIIQNEPVEPANGGETVEAIVGRPRRSLNLAARMGRWSASHKKTAIFGWLAFIVVASMIGNAVGTKQLDPTRSGTGESGHVQAVLADHFKQPQGDQVLIQSTTKTVDDPAFRAAVTDVLRTVGGLRQVKKIESPFAAGNEDRISKDRRTALVAVELRTTDAAKAKTLDAPVEKAIIAAGTRHPGIAIEEFGVNVETQLDRAVVNDFKKAGLFSVPVTLIVLVVAFGALIAAGLPLLLALTAVFATMAVLALPSQLMPLDKDISVIVLLIGLAVGVDYSLFYLKRAREERAAGRGERAALEAAAATSGRSVLVSGLTVMVAMAGMLFTGDKMFMGFGIATMIVVAIAVLGSLTVLPATLAALGDKVDRLRVPFLHGRGRSDRGSRVWSAILDRVLRRPLLSIVIAGGLLLTLAAPALQMHISEPGIATYPQNLSSIQTYNKLQKAFPGEPNSAQVLVKTNDAHNPAVNRAIADLQRRAIATGQFANPTSVDYSNDGTIALVSIAMQGDGVDNTALTALQTLRRTVIPATVGKLDGADVGVTGNTASQKDSNDQMKHAAPFVFAFVLTLAFLLMLLTFRSVVIAVKAVLLNLLSVAAAYGALVLVFQHGWGKGVLGFGVTPGGIVGWLPIFLFVILFGLSMDYHVFILSRIRELHDRGLSTDQAISEGIRSTAGTVTSAAVVMVGVFAVFTALPIVDLKEMGIGLAVAVLIDATLVRAVLLPASMKLLGNANWYLPSWLGWLPRTKHEALSGRLEAEPAFAQGA
ncbi:MAG: MMPL family transporter [Gaiellaceae bacterium]